MTDNGLPLRVARAVRGWTASEVARLPSKFSLEVLREVYGEDLVKAEEHYGAVQTRERGAPRKLARIEA